MGFAPEQWGSHENRNSTDFATMKLLTFDSCHHRRTWIAMMAIDVAACYERIITYLSNVYERLHGLPKNACVAKGNTVFEMLRKVRTAYGESDAFYTSVIDDLMHGGCQGKTSSPPSWAIYTISMLRALSKFNPRVNIQCVEGIHTIHRMADMFVGDKDMWTESSDNGLRNEKYNLMNDFRQAAQVLERILFALGGLRTLNKCYWWMVGWKWIDGIPKLTPRQIRIRCLPHP